MSGVDIDGRPMGNVQQPNLVTRLWRGFFGCFWHAWEIYKEPLDPNDGWVVRRCNKCGRIKKQGPVPIMWDYNP